MLAVGTQFLIDFLLSCISGVRNLPCTQLRHSCQLCSTNERLLGEIRRWKKSTSPFALAVMGVGMWVCCFLLCSSGFQWPVQCQEH